MGKYLRNLAALLVFLALFVGCNPAPEEPSPTVIVAPTITPIPVTVVFPTPTSSSPIATPLPVESPLVTPLSVSGVLNVPRQGGTAGQPWTLGDFRYAFHKDRLRIVWEMAESGTTIPKYRAVEVDNAAAPFPTGYDAGWGAARIDLIVSALSAPNFPLSTRLPVELPGNPVASRIGLYPTSEGGALGFSIGLHHPLDYDIYELTDPVRLVIDLVYP